MFLVYVVKVFAAESTTDSSTMHAEAPCPPTNCRERKLVVMWEMNMWNVCLGVLLTMKGLLNAGWWGELAWQPLFLILQARSKVVFIRRVVVSQNA